MAADVYESSVSVANPPIPTNCDHQYMKAAQLDMSKYLEMLIGRRNFLNLTDIEKLGKSSLMTTLVSAIK